MNGLELSDYFNARKPAFVRAGLHDPRARRWHSAARSACPHTGVTPGIRTQHDSTTYDLITTANLSQPTAGHDKVTPKDYAAENEDPPSPSLQKVIRAVSDAARSCKAETP